MSSIDRIELATALEGRSRREQATPASADWRDGLPVMRGTGFVLREVTLHDAPMLLAALHTEEVSRFIEAPPNSVEAFQQFIAAARRRRKYGEGACFAIVPKGMHAAVGLIELQAMQPDFGVARWSFALASSE